MKTLKKALSIVLGLAIMLSCVLGMQVSAAAEGAAVALSVGNAAAVDGTVTVPVSVDANTGFRALGIEVSYDANVLKLTDAAKLAFVADVDEVGACSQDYTVNPYVMQWAYVTDEDITATGTIANLTFEVLDASAETTEVTVEVTEAWDANKVAVATTTTAGTVTVKEEPAGPTVDPALVFSGASLGYGTSSLQVNFRVANTVLDLYSDMHVVIIPQKYDANLNLVEVPEEIVIPKSALAAAGSKNKSYLFTDIELHELGLNIDYMLRAYDAEGNLVAVSETFTTSAASYLKEQFVKQASNAKFRTLVTDTLVVGYEAIERMAVSYPDSFLAKDLEENGSIISDFDTSEATKEIPSYNTIDTFNSYNTSYKTTSSTHQVRKSVAIGKVPYITYRIKDANGVLDLNKLSFKVSYTGATGDFNETYTTANGDISLISGWVNFKLYDISIPDGDKDIFVEAYYDGAKVFDTTYSVESYLGTRLSDANIGAVSTALIKLGISFRDYTA